MKKILALVLMVVCAALIANAQILTPGGVSVTETGGSNGETTDNTTQGRIPYKNAEAFDDSPLYYDSVTPKVVCDVTFEAPGGTINIGETSSVSAGSDDMLVTEEVSGITHVLVRSGFDDTGSETPHYSDWGAASTEGVQTDFSTVITDNPITYSLVGTSTSPERQHILGTTYKANGVMTNFRFKVTDNSTGIVTQHVPSKAEWNAGTGYTLIAGDNYFDFFSNEADTAGNFKIGRVPVTLEEGQQVDFEIRADSMDILGEAGGQPYQTSYVQVGTPLEGVFKDEDGNVEITGTVTATTFLGDLNGTINTATTAVTQSSDDNSTKVATTAYTDAAVGVEDNWDRTGARLSPANSGDDVSTTGSIGAGILSPKSLVHTKGISGELLGENQYSINLRLTAVSGTRYYLIGTLDADITNGHIQLNGIIAGRNETHGRALVDIMFSAETTFNVFGAVYGDFASSDIVVYLDTDNKYYIYLKATSFSECNFNTATVGTNGTLDWDGTYTTLTPTGSLYYTLSTDIGEILRVNESAILDLQSTTKGFLPPRLTDAQKLAISSPTEGLVLYDADDNELDVYNGTAWKALVMTDASTLTPGGVAYANAGNEIEDDPEHFSYDSATETVTAPTLSVSRAYKYEDGSTQSHGAIPDSFGCHLETAKYKQSLDVSAQDSNPNGIAFKECGMQMFMVGRTTETLFGYDVPTAWNVSTANVVSSLVITAYDDDPSGIDFDHSGINLYVAGNGTDSVLQYYMADGYDIDNAVYLHSFDVSAQELTIRDVEVSKTGLKMWIVGVDSDTVYQYDIEVAGNVSTAEYNGVFFDLSVWDDAPHGLEFNGDETIMYISGNSSDSLIEFGLEMPGEVDTAVHQYSLSIVTTDNNPTELFLSDDGAHLYFCGSQYDSVYELDMGLKMRGGISFGSLVDPIEFNDGTTQTQGATPDAFRGHVETALYAYTFDVSDKDTNPVDVEFRPNGLQAYVMGEATDIIYEYALTVANELSTAYYLRELDSPSMSGATRGIAFLKPGVKMYIVEATGDDIQEWGLQDPWNISTATRIQVFDIQAQTGSPEDLALKPDGSRIFVVDSGNVFQYELDINGDVSTAEYTQTLVISGDVTSATGISFREDGLIMRISDVSSVHEYSLYEAWNILTASHTQEISVAVEDNAVTGVFITQYGNKMFASGSQNDNIYEYDLGLQLPVITGIDGELNVIDNISMQGGDINFRVQTDAASQSIVFYQDIASGGAEAFRIKYQDDSTPGGMIFTGDAGVTFDNTNGKSFYFSTSGADTNALMNIYNYGTNAGDLYLYSGDRNPLNNVNPLGVSLYAREDSTNYGLYVGDGDATSWKELFSLETDGSAEFPGLIGRSLSSAITASTTQSQGQQPLTTSVNNVTVIANDNDVVTLPAASATVSYQIVIYNSDAAETLQIFPASGDDLGAGVNASTTLAAGANVTFGNSDATYWRTE